MHTKLLLSLYCLIFICGSFDLCAQSISRSVISTAGETFSKKISGSHSNENQNQVIPNDKEDNNNTFTLSYTIGESVAISLFSPRTENYLLIGFEQPDDTEEKPQLFVKAKEQKVILFPNPVVENTLNIRFMEIPEGSLTLQIISVPGTVVRNENMGNYFSKFPSYKIDVSQLKPGIYFIKISNATFNYESKFIKM